MPSFQDSAFIILLGLLLFGPKGMAKMARQVGKLVGEFRRASAEFRLQMEDELRLSEQEDQQKKIAAMEAAAPVAPVISDLPAPAEEIPEPEHPHMPPVENSIRDTGFSGALPPADEPVPLPIATSGELAMMPPATGLPVGRGAPARSEDVGGVFDAIPHGPAGEEYGREHEVHNA